MADADQPPANSLTDGGAEATPSAPAAPASSGNGDARPPLDDLAAALREYNDHAAPKSNSDARDGKTTPDGRLKDKLTKPATEAPEPSAPQIPAKAEPPRAMSDDDMMLTALRVQSQQVLWEQFLHHQHFEKLKHQEAADTAEVLAMANDQLEGMKHLPPDFAKRWLYSQYAMDDELKEAWDNKRNENGEVNAAARAVVNRALKKMVQEARKVPTREDLIATEDREAVTAAVRGASSKMPPAKAPNLSRMNDQEFADYKDSVMPQ